MILEFLDNKRVGMEIDGDAEELPYDMQGNEVIIRGVEGSMVLVKRG